MRLRQLEYLVAICDVGSFGAAAAQLYVAQPSLSQQIKALERDLGADLLERGRGPVKLTAAGRALLPYARSLLQSAAEARDAVRAVAEGRQGDVHVLTIRSVASGVLPPSMARWHSLHPETVLRLHDFSHRRDLETAMRAGRGDLAVGPRPAGWQGPLHTLGFEELLVIGAAPFPEGEVADVDSLRDASWVLYEPEQGMAEVVEWIGHRLGIELRAVARTGQVAAALLSAVEGVGYAVAPENAVPPGWRRHARRIGPGVFRELVVYARDDPVQLPAHYLELLRTIDLPLNAQKTLPEGCLVR
jgi:DNA-binding transcriptional LysR family regulator